MSHYHHISTEERKSISELYYAGNTIRKIARQLQRSPATISRELRRNRSDVGSAVLYHPEAATLAYQKRRQRCVRPHILCTNIELRHTVHFLLGYLYWSPAQISSRLKKEGTFQISAATIYRALENGQLRPLLRYFLRHKYKTFGKASKKRRNCFEKRIEDRPVEADMRSEVGHFEGDTIIGHGHRSCIVTLVDRKSRFLLAGKCDSKRAEDVTPVVIRLLSKLPPEKRKTITFDQGPEFSRPDLLEQALGVQVYFANAHSPWERGTNENTNGLLRQFYSKERGLGDVTQSDVDRVTALLNMRPRACLHFCLPFESFFASVLLLTCQFEWEKAWACGESV